MNELIGLPYSPWTEKARWALDHHRVDYVEKEYLPMLGEVSLRYRTGRFFERVTVPVFIEPTASTFDSLNIIRRADALGQGHPLVPQHRESSVLDWNRRSEISLDAARALIIERCLFDDSAARSALPRFVPKSLRGAAIPVARLGSLFVKKKYGAVALGAREILRRELAGLRNALSGKATLFDEFSAADIAMAAPLQFIEPFSEKFGGSADSLQLNDESLKTEFADLLEWRGSLYEAHRPAIAKRGFA